MPGGDDDDMFANAGAGGGDESMPGGDDGSEVPLARAATSAGGKKKSSRRARTGGAEKVEEEEEEAVVASKAGSSMGSSAVPPLRDGGGELAVAEMEAAAARRREAMLQKDHNDLIAATKHNDKAMDVVGERLRTSQSVVRRGQARTKELATLLDQILSEVLGDTHTAREVLADLKSPSPSSQRTGAKGGAAVQDGTSVSVTPSMLANQAASDSTKMAEAVESCLAACEGLHGGQEQLKSVAEAARSARQASDAKVREVEAQCKVLETKVADERARADAAVAAAAAADARARPPTPRSRSRGGRGGEDDDDPFAHTGGGGDESLPGDDSGSRAGAGAGAVSLLSAELKKMGAALEAERLRSKALEGEVAEEKVRCREWSQRAARQYEDEAKSAANADLVTAEQRARGAEEQRNRFEEELTEARATAAESGEAIRVLTEATSRHEAALSEAKAAQEAAVGAALRNAETTAEAATADAAKANATIDTLKFQLADAETARLKSAAEAAGMAAAHGDQTRHTDARSKGLELYCSDLQRRVVGLRKEAEQTQRERSAYANDSAVRALMEQTEAIALLRKQLIEGEERLTEERAAFAATVAGARRRRPRGQQGQQGQQGNGQSGPLGGVPLGRLGAERGASVRRDGRDGGGHGGGQGTSAMGGLGGGLSRGGGGRRGAISAEDLQRFMSDQSGLLVSARGQIAEWERRAAASTREWSRVEGSVQGLRDENRSLQTARRQQERMWRGMIAQRDKQMMALNDVLAEYAAGTRVTMAAGTGGRGGRGLPGLDRQSGANAAKVAAAQILVRQVYELQQEVSQMAAAAANNNQGSGGAAGGAAGGATGGAGGEAKGAFNAFFTNDGSGGGGGGGAPSVSASRVTELEDQVRQMQIEGGAAQVARMADIARRSELRCAAEVERTQTLQVGFGWRVEGGVLLLSVCVCVCWVCGMGTI